MTDLIGLHLQDPVPGWTEAIKKLPYGTVCKFFQTESCSEAKSVNRNIKTLKRYYHPNQGSFWHNVDPYDGARRWLESFVDGTFRQHAVNIDYIEGLNEEMALVKPPDELVELIEWNEALCDLWYGDYHEKYPDLRHIDLVLCNTAIGNDIPADIARLTGEYGFFPIVGYHPYVPVLNKTPLANEARYYSQRWQEMDKDWALRGFKVRWMFTEIGAVGYHMDNGTPSLHPNDGWQHPNVCGGDINAYIKILEYWANGVASSQAYREGRLLSGQIFTNSVASSGWGLFQLNMPALQTVLDHFAQWQPTGTVPPEPPQPPPSGIDRNALFAASKQTVNLSLNSDFALHKAIARDGLVPKSNEYDHFNNGIGYRCQNAYKAGSINHYVYYCKIGDWGNVKREVFTG